MATSLPPDNNPFESLVQSALTCNVCLSDFDTEHRRPLILPRCGHTFCRTCVKDLACQGDIVCPECRTKYPNAEVDSFPINFNIQCIAASPSATSALPVKKNREEDSSLSLCLEHQIRIAFWCTTCEVAACGECLFDDHPKPEHHIARIQDVVNQVKEKAQLLSQESSTEVVKRLGESLLRSLRDVSDLQEAAHLLHETVRLKRAASTMNDLASITSVFERSKVIRQSVAELEHRDEQQTSQRLPSETVIATRPSILALSDNGCLGKVTVEKMGIHVYSLQSPSTAYSVAIKLGILTSCMSKEEPLVFMDIKAGDRRLGRVYINLDGRMKRSQQFVALCLGTHGHSYKGSKFDGVNEIGLPGEYIRGGDYRAKGGLGGEAIMDNLEWGGSWSKPKKAGQVCGIGGEQPRRFGALFAICLKDKAEDTFHCPFGEVTQGLDVLEITTRHKPFNLVHVSDCGVVIPLHVDRKCI